MEVYWHSPGKSRTSRVHFKGIFWHPVSGPANHIWRKLNFNSIEYRHFQNTLVVSTAFPYKGWKNIERPFILTPKGTTPIAWAVRNVNSIYYDVVPHPFLIRGRMGGTWSFRATYKREQKNYIEIQLLPGAYIVS